MGEIGFPEDYRSRVRAALPRGVPIDSDFWDELWGIVWRYILAKQHRKRHPPTDRAKQWRRFEKALRKFKRELVDIRGTIDRHTIYRRTIYTDAPPTWWINLMRAVTEAQPRASEYSQSYEKAGVGFRARSNPERQRLYNGVLHLWQARLGQQLTYSNDKRGKPGGPLIRFFTACIGPILGDAAPSPKGIVTIIERGRRRSKL
jgi:hypothetical protein